MLKTYNFVFGFLKVVNLKFKIQAFQSHGTKLNSDLCTKSLFVHTNCSQFSRPSIDPHCKYFRILILFIFVLLHVISAGKPGVHFSVCSLSGHRIGTIRYQLHKATCMSRPRTHTEVHTRFSSRNIT